MTLLVEAQQVVVSCDVCGYNDTLRGADWDGLRAIANEHLHPRPPVQTAHDWASVAENVLYAALQRMDRLGYPPAQHETRTT